MAKSWILRPLTDECGGVRAIYPAMVNQIFTDDDLLLVAIGLVKAAGRDASTFPGEVARTFAALTQEISSGSTGGWSDGTYGLMPVLALYSDGVASAPGSAHFV